jgi:hypothetical protein
MNSPVHLPASRAAAWRLISASISLARARRTRLAVFRLEWNKRVGFHRWA